MAVGGVGRMRRPNSHFGFLGKTSSCRPGLLLDSSCLWNLQVFQASSLAGLASQGSLAERSTPFRRKDSPQSPPKWAISSSSGLANSTNFEGTNQASSSCSKPEKATSYTFDLLQLLMGFVAQVEIHKDLTQSHWIISLSSNQRLREQQRLFTLAAEQE